MLSRANQTTLGRPVPVSHSVRWMRRDRAAVSSATNRRRNSAKKRGGRKPYAIAVAGAGGTAFGHAALGHIVYSIIYVAILYVCANHCFMLIDHLPQHALSWMGANGQAMPQMGSADKIEGAAALASQYINNQGMGAFGQTYKGIMANQQSKATSKKEAERHQQVLDALGGRGSGGGGTDPIPTLGGNNNNPLGGGSGGALGLAPNLGGSWNGPGGLGGGFAGYGQVTQTASLMGGQAPGGGHAVQQQQQQQQQQADGKPTKEDPAQKPADGQPPAGISQGQGHSATITTEVASLGGRVGNMQGELAATDAKANVALNNNKGAPPSGGGGTLT